MNRFKKWLFEKYVPRYENLTLVTENDKLKTELLFLKQQLAESEACINALKYSLQQKQSIEIILKGVDKFEHNAKCVDKIKRDD